MSSENLNKYTKKNTEIAPIAMEILFIVLKNNKKIAMESGTGVFLKLIVVLQKKIPLFRMELFICK
jgi:hypothetical protein